jgi:erythromycin esterase
LLAFAHNMHLQRGQARWQLGPHALAYWPAGAQVHEMLGRQYAVIGTWAGVSESLGLAQPEPSTLESLLLATPGPGRLMVTHRGAAVPADVVAALPTRSGSTKLPGGYFPMNAQTLNDFDALILI